ncbi:MAG TPA: 3'-5' exonuclease, partial [Acidobacteriota bacterium]|nr:3'-5' exonuclease [Acidobacteriota bacterium]
PAQETIMVSYLVFDIETRVDKDLVKEIYDPENSLTIDQAYDTARDRILEKSKQQSDFFPIPFHIPIAISTLQADENYRVLSLGCMGADRFSEAELVARFWKIFENAQTLITFNGRGFDLPVLETRALKHGIPLPRYFGAGQARGAYRGNRYSDDFHIDLCDFLSNFGAAFRRSSLNVLAKLIGLPGKYNIEGDDVEYLYRQERLKEINQYCMIDVLQTYLLFLRVELLRGKLNPQAYGKAVAAAREELTQMADNAGPDNFLLDFLRRWKMPEGLPPEPNGAAPGAAAV